MRLRNPKSTILYLSLMLSLLLLLGIRANAQVTATVAGTITDVNGQTYALGNYTIEYIKPPNGAVPLYITTGLPVSPLRFSGNLDAAGAFAGIAVTKTTQIAPTGGLWKFTICSLATSPCFSYSTSVTGNVDLSAPLSAASYPIAVVSSSNFFQFIPRAYQDNEVSGAQAGSMYYNILTPGPKWYTGSAWTGIPTGYNLPSIYSYGATCNGIADDSAAFVAARDSGSPGILLPPATCVVNTMLALNSNQYWLGNNTTIKHTGAGTIIFSATDKDNWGVTGVTFQGVNGGAVAGPTAEALLYIAGGHKFIVDNVIFKNSNGWGIKRDPGGSTAPRGDHGIISNTFYDFNYYGIEFTAGTGAEYVEITTCQMTRNTFPLVIASGNISVANCNAVENTNGVYVGAGANNAHGEFVNVQSNHNTNYQYKFDGVTNGFSVSNSHCYADAGVLPGLWLVSSKGVKFNNGNIDCLIQSDTTAGQNEINNNYIAGAFGDQAPAGSSTTASLTLGANFNATGLWQFNNAGPNKFSNSSASQFIEIGSGGANGLTRGIKFTDSAGTTAGVDEIIPNTVGTNSQRNFYVGGSAAGDLKLRIDDAGLISLGAPNGTAGGGLDCGAGAWKCKHIITTLAGTCPTAAAVGATCTSGTLTFSGAAFADTSYTLVCTLVTPTGVPVLSSVTKAAGNFTVTIAALTAVAANAGVDCLAVHD